MMRPTTRTAFIAAMIVTIGGFVFGLDLGVIAGTFGYLTAQWGLTDIQIGNVGAAPGFGAIFALLFAGPVSNRIGRKKTIQVIAALYLVSAVTSALALGYWSLVAARFLGGLAFCSLSLASMYIGEIAPSNLRGRMVAMNQINITIGLTAAFFVNFVIQSIAESSPGWAAPLQLGTNAWRWMLGSEIVPALAWLLLLAWIPESPRWLMSAGREAEARKAMARVMPQDGIEGEVASIRQSMQRSHGAKTLGAQLRELFSRHARAAAIIGIVIAAIQPITGINAILTYAPIVFSQSGMSDPFKSTIWIGVVSVVANLGAFALVDRLGRRPVVLLGLLWCIVSLGACGWAFHHARYSFDEASLARVGQKLGAEPAAAVAGLESAHYASDLAFMQEMRRVLGEQLANDNKTFLIGQAAHLDTGLVLVAILSFIAAFNVSIGPVMWVVFSEIFPTQLRGIAIPTAHLVTAIVNYFVQFLFPWQLANQGARDIFLFYCICVAAGLAALFFLLPETKNKTIEQIEAELVAGRRKAGR